MILIPQTSKNLQITVQFGGFNATGFSAELLLKLNGPGTPVTVTLPLTVLGDGTSGYYTTTGTEFSTPGVYDAQVKIYSGSTAVYSAQSPQAVNIQATFG